MFGERKIIKTSVGRSKGQSISYTGFNESKSEATEPIISPTDISQRKFGEITFKIVKNNTAQKAGHGRIKFIPANISQKMDSISIENQSLFRHGIDPSLYRNEHGTLTMPIEQIISEKSIADNLL